MWGFEKCVFENCDFEVVGVEGSTDYYGFRHVLEMDEEHCVDEVDGYGDEEIDWKGEEGWGGDGSVGWNVEVVDVDVVAAIVVELESVRDQRVVGVGFVGKGIFDTRVGVQRWIENS